MLWLHTLFLSIPLLILGISFAPTPVGAELEGSPRKNWEETIEQIRVLKGWSPKTSWPLLMRCERTLLDQPSPKRKLELDLAGAPVKALREGYQKTRRGLIGWLKRLPVEEGKEKHVWYTRTHLGVVDLDLRYGRTEKAYRRILQLLETVPVRKLPAFERTKILQMTARTNLQLGRPLRAEEVLRQLRAYTPISISERKWNLFSAKVYGSFGPQDRDALARMGRSLDRFGENVTADLPTHLLANYWFERLRLALLEGRPERAKTFLRVGEEALSAFPQSLPRARFRMVRWLYNFPAERTTGVENVTVERLQAFFTEAANPAAFDQLVGDARGWKVNFPDNKVFQQRLAQAGELVMQKDSSFRKEEQPVLLRSYDRRWLAERASLERGEGASASRVSLFYPILLFLLLLSVALALWLRNRMQSHVTAELREAVKKARKAEQVAEEANRYKSQFLANVSHEIRNPMNGIVGMASLLDDLIKDPRQRHCLETIQICSQNLLVLLNDLVDLSRIEAGALEMEQRPFSPEALLDHCRVLAEDRFAKKQIPFLIEKDRSLPACVVGDPEHMGQLLMKLVFNALEQTESGSVCLRAEFVPAVGVNGTFVFSVEDTGNGYPEASLPFLFEPFTETKAGPVSHQTGLALSISRRLTEALGGRVEVESRLGEGSRFTVRLPVRKTEQEPEELTYRFHTFPLRPRSQSTVLHG